VSEEGWYLSTAFPTRITATGGNRLAVPMVGSCGGVGTGSSFQSPKRGGRWRARSARRMPLCDSGTAPRRAGTPNGASSPRAARGRFQRRRRVVGSPTLLVSAQWARVISSKRVCRGFESRRRLVRRSSVGRAPKPVPTVRTAGSDKRKPPT
jgi:hypothetical protein